MAISLSINGVSHSVDIEPETPLLWVLRDEIGLTGTKFGCGVSRCGACMVHVDGQPAKACQTAVSAVVGKQVTTIEGLSKDSNHPVQKAWREVGVPQCGYCQSGQIMSTAALLEKSPKPTDRQIDEAMAGNICRCGTYQRIKAGIRRASQLSGA